MKKLSLSILALLLAATTFAAPPQWVEGVASKDVNAAVAADPSAIHRGGALIVDHATLQTQLLPWSDGDSITLDFSGLGELVDCGETPVGWECGVDGSTWRAGVADLDGVKGIGKLAGALDDFTAPGAQSYVRIPIAEVPSTGEWRPIDKQLGGDWGDFNFVLQPELTAQEITDGATRPDWAVNSIAVYHKTKRNDNTTGFKYMTGKAAHLPAPVAVGFRSNQTTITGWTYGAWEIDTGTGRLTKVFDAAVIQGWNNTASVVVDATLGYEVIGGTNTVAFRQQCNGSWTMPEDGDIESFTVYQRVGTFLQGGGVYPDNGATPTGSALLAQTTAGLPDVDFNWNTAEMLGSATSGQLLWMVYQGSNAVSTFYDSIAGQDHRTGNTTGYSPGNMPDPMGITSLFAFGQKLSMYFTYTAAAPAGGATPPGPLNLGLGLSL